MFAHDHLAKIYGPLSFIFSFVCARPFARSKIRVAIDLFLLFAHNHSSKIYGSLLFILSFVHLLFLWFSSNYFFYLHAATWPKYMILFCLFYFNLYKAMRSVLPLYSVHYIHCWLMMSSSKFLWNYSVPQLVGQGEGQEVSPAFFWKNKKRVLILQKTSEKSTLYVCIDRLNSNLDCSFKGFFEKTLKFFPAGRFFCMSYMKRLSKCLYSKKPPLTRKISGCAPVTLQESIEARWAKLNGIWIDLLLNFVS